MSAEAVLPEMDEVMTVGQEAGGAATLDKELQLRGSG